MGSPPPPDGAGAGRGVEKPDPLQGHCAYRQREGRRDGTGVRMMPRYSRPFDRITPACGPRRRKGGAAMIVIYVHALTATGVVRNARLLAAALAERGHRVELVTAAPGGEGVPGVRPFPLLQRSHASSLIEKLIDRKSGVSGERVSLRVGHGGRRTI